MELMDELIEAYLNGSDEFPHVYDQMKNEVLIVMEGDLDDDSIPIPYMTSTEAYRLMAEFAEKQEAKVSNELIEVLNGKKPFRAFKDHIKGLDIENDWYNFENAHAKQEMTEWIGQYK